jgi:hypothetical protein
MMWAILTSIGSLASLIGLVLQLFKTKDRIKNYGLLILFVSFAVASGILWWQNITLARENAQLRQARNQAAELLKAWPKPENLDFVSTAQCRGVVLSGLAFLEAHQENFPKTFEALNRLFIDAFGVTSKEREKWWEESANVHEAAAVMIQLIKALQI